MEGRIMAQSEKRQDTCPKCGKPLQVEYGTGYCHGCRVIVDPQLIQGQSCSKTPATNADRIRSMSDEELAACSMVCPYQIDEYFCTCGTDCEKCRLEWLQQPAKEVNPC
jgi:hypothetical protein